jgi:hypothetical protein
MTTLRSLLVALTAAGALAAAPALACDDVSPSAGATTMDKGAVSDPHGTSAAQGDVVEGQVAAVDHQSGRLILETKQGVLHLVAPPEELAGIQEGDVIQVAFVDEDSI